MTETQLRLIAIHLKNDPPVELKLDAVQTIISNAVHQPGSLSGSNTLSDLNRRVEKHFEGGPEKMPVTKKLLCDLLDEVGRTGSSIPSDIIAAKLKLLSSYNNLMKLGTLQQY